jgi:hypothetical protein
MIPESADQIKRRILARIGHAKRLGELTMNFTIVDKPESRYLHTFNTKYGDLRKALLDLPEGKALRVEPSFLPLKGSIGQTLRMEPHGYKARARRLPDGVYIWLEKIPTPPVEEPQQ